MGVAEEMCDRIFMIFKGRKVLDGTLDEIQARYGHDTVRVRTEAGRAALDGEPGVEAVSDYGNLQEVRLTTDPQAFLARLIERTPVFHFEVTRPSLHDIFVRIAQPDADAGADRGGGPMIAWRKVWTVAVTEFQHAVRSKAFIIGVALLPTLGRHLGGHPEVRRRRDRQARTHGRGGRRDRPRSIRCCRSSPISGTRRS